MFIQTYVNKSRQSIKAVRKSEIFSFCSTKSLQRGPSPVISRIALESAANSPVVGRVRTCPAPGTTQAVHAPLPRRFVLVTVHLTSSHSQSAGTFLTPQ